MTTLQTMKKADTTAREGLMAVLPAGQSKSLDEIRSALEEQGKDIPSSALRRVTWQMVNDRAIEIASDGRLRRPR